MATGVIRSTAVISGPANAVSAADPTKIRQLENLHFLQKLLLTCASTYAKLCKLRKEPQHIVVADQGRCDEFPVTGPYAQPRHPPGACEFMAFGPNQWGSE
jgi:hypothetical protein